MSDWPLPLWALMMLLAPFVGSFLGVLARRLPVGRAATLGRSECESCGHALGVADLVPLASYAWLRGRCRYCATTIAPAHLAIELACLAVALTSALVDGGNPPLLWADCVLGWTLLVLSWIDCTHMQLPDVLTLPLVLLGLGATMALDPDAMADHAGAAILGYISFRLIAALYKWRRGRDGLGQGDAKLLAAAGAWVGLASLPTVMLGGAVLGLGIAGVQWACGRRIAAATVIPFGPCLAAATWIVWLVAATPA